MIDSLKGVDITVMFNPSNREDITVCEAIESIKPDYFTKGGDRTGIENIPEWPISQKVGIEIVTNVGKDKIISSTQILQDWVDFVNSKKS